MNFAIDQSRARLALAGLGFVMAAGGLWVCLKSGLVNHVVAPPLIVTFVKPAPELPVLVKGKTSTQSLEPAASIRQAVWNKTLSFDARVRGVRALGASLDAPERQLLLDYLRQPQPDDGLNGPQREALKNDVINALRAQVPPVAELTSVLIAIAQDQSETPVMRDYALQHLSQYREKAAAVDPKQATQIDEALWQAAGESKEASAGTALLALAYSVDAKAPGARSPSDLGSKALAIASDPNARVGNRMTALSIAGRMGEKGAIDVAFKNFQQPKQFALNMVGLAVLRQAQAQGWKPTPDQRGQLQQLALMAPGPEAQSARKLLEKL